MDIYIVFFFVLFIFIHVRFEGNNKYAKKVLNQPWNSLTLQISLSLREKHDKIVFTLQGYFGRSDNLLRSPRIFVISDKRSEFLSITSANWNVLTLQLSLSLRDR